VEEATPLKAKNSQVATGATSQQLSTTTGEVAFTLLEKDEGSVPTSALETTRLHRKDVDSAATTATSPRFAHLVASINLQVVATVKD
jgi:hypothetical protein